MSNKKESPVSNNFLNADISHEKEKQRAVFLRELFKLNENLKEKDLKELFLGEENVDFLRKAGFVCDFLNDFKTKLEKDQVFSDKMAISNFFYDKIVNSLEVLNMSLRRLKLTLGQVDKKEKDLFEENYLKKLLKDKIEDLYLYLEENLSEEKIKKEMETKWGEEAA